jgi:hypothetical protein
MTAYSASAHPSADDAFLEQQEESARYALLRRLAPTLRHHLAGAMQPIGMVSAIMERRLQSAQPDLEVLRENSRSINTLSRTAATTGMNLLTWVAPRENGSVTVHDGVEECVGMLSTDLAFRGFTVVNHITPSPMATSVFVLRSVFCAALIALTDAALAPASVEISCETDGGLACVRIRLRSEPGAGVPDDPRAYRKLSWSDVQILAAAEMVELSRGTDHAELRFTTHEDADVTV